MKKYRLCYILAGMAISLAFGCDYLFSTLHVKSAYFDSVYQAGEKYPGTNLYDVLASTVGIFEWASMLAAFVLLVTAIIHSLRVHVSDIF